MALMCDSCGKTFVNKSHLNDHKKYHEEEQCKCTECATKFKNQTLLKKHKMRCLLISCKVCDAKLQRRTLGRHMISKHGTGEELKCNQCVFITQRKDEMARHKTKVHGNEKIKYECDQCNFTSLENMQ